MKKVFKIVLVASILIINHGYLSYANERFSNLNDLENNIYAHLKNRDTSFSLSYTGSTSEFKSNISQAIIDAYSKDDYTERSWVEIKPKAQETSGEIEATINATYLTTKEQEDYVDTEIKKVVDSLLHYGMTDIEKVRAINDYIISRYEYDYTYKSNSAYSALTTGITICQGYSMTAYKMLTYAGIENRIIIGSVNGISHSWNYVKVGSVWYHLDITNNDATGTDKYFLVGDSTLESNNYVWNKKSYTQGVEK